MATTLLLSPPVDSEREAMAALAATCAHRALVHMLVTRDLERWDKLTSAERSQALARARRRVDAVVPHPTLDFER
jgi:hypothetical protein